VASTAWAAVTISSVRVVRCDSSSALVGVERGGQLVAMALDVRLELGLELAQALAEAASAGGLLLDVRREALATPRRHR
jgi:hypothetical protein